MSESEDASFLTNTKEMSSLLFGKAKQMRQQESTPAES